MKTITRFSSIVEVIDEYADAANVTLNAGAREALLGIDDYEATEWLVIDGRIAVCYDTISGDVYLSEPLDELIAHTNDFARVEGVTT